MKIKIFLLQEGFSIFLQKVFFYKNLIDKIIFFLYNFTVIQYYYDLTSRVVCWKQYCAWCKKFLYTKNHWKESNFRLFASWK